MRFAKRLVCLAGVALVVTGTSRSSSAAEPTFAKDVAPIVYQKCVKCHRPGTVAPMSLLDYSSVRPWAKAIKAKVVAREMPPWFADPAQSLPFKNDNRLSQAQIDTIVAWVDAGAPKGEDSDMPPAPVYKTKNVGWEMGSEPDAIIEMPIEFEVPADGEIRNRTFWIYNPFKEDKFAEAREVRTNLAVVHHAGGDHKALCEGCSISPGGDMLLPDGTPEEKATREQLKKFGVSNSVAAETLFVYVPGFIYERDAPGTGKRLPASHTAIGFGMHYQPSGKPEKDRTGLGLWWVKGKNFQEVYDSTTSFEGSDSQYQAARVAEGKIVPPRDRNQRGNDDDGAKSEIPNIPAYVDNWKMVNFRPVPHDITVVGLRPHMHLRGKDWKWLVTYPDGSVVSMIYVPRYDFHWQLSYELETPLKVPAGSVITSVARWDNSAKNPYNPAPEKEVYWSEQTWDEMMTDRLMWMVDGEAPKTSTTQQQQQH